jgi:GH25 family lysozyme M1 (1,4-beta-N-acetylmuramidase)
MPIVDTSFFQHYPSFERVKATGVDAVIMKAVDVEQGFPVIDSTYIANRTTVRSLGMRAGSYLFNGPYDPAAAADYYWSVIDWKPGEFAAIDVENALGVNRWNPSQVLQFCHALIGHGIPPYLILVYMSSSVTRVYDWSSVVALGVELWVAQYNANDGTRGTLPSVAYWPDWALWQYTSAGVIDGILGRVDVSDMSVRYASLGMTPINSTKRKKKKKMNGLLWYCTTASPDGAIKLYSMWFQRWPGDALVELDTGNSSTSSEYTAYMRLYYRMDDGSVPVGGNDVEGIRNLYTEISGLGIQALITLRGQVQSYAPAGTVSSGVDLRPVLDAISNLPKPPTSGQITLS